jgi:uncharacterized coiled-coil protein SlyX
MAAAASAQAQAQTMAQINVAVTKQALGAMEQQGQQMVGLIQDAAEQQSQMQAKSVEAGKGSALDVSG